MSLIENAFKGVLAGAAGSTGLNTVTYADMAMRARPASSLPERVVTKVAEQLGAPDLSKPPEELSDEEKNRRAGLGALLGYADGFTAALVFGVVRPAIRRVPWFFAGLGLAAATFAMSEGGATKLGQTNPKEWQPTDWIADLVPRCVYGWITCIVFDQMTRR